MIEKTSTTLAIDPGNVYSAYAILANSDYRIVEKAKEENEKVLQRVFQYASEDPGDKRVVIEMIASYGMAVGSTVFDTCIWIGRYWQMLESNGIHPEFIVRSKVKHNLCHSTAAKDSNVTAALVERFSPKNQANFGKGTKNNPGWFHGVSKDIWAAIGVGVTSIDVMKGLYQL